MGTAIVQSKPPQTSLLSLGCVLGDNLWNTARVPGQLVTFIAQGQLLHAPILPISTQSALTVELSSPITLVSGSQLPYMIRAKTPRLTLTGPVVQTSPNQVVVQAPANAIPTPYACLVYLGGRSSHPVHMCAMQSPQLAKQHVYAVVSATPLEDPVALRSVALADPRISLAQLTPHLAMGALELSQSANLTGLTYEWPYPVDQPGDVWLLTPTLPTTGMPMIPRTPGGECAVS